MMNLIARTSGGRNILARPQARAAWYPAASVHPSQVEVYWRYDNEPPAAGRKVGVFSPTQQVSIPYNPLVDRNVLVGTISIAPDGTRSARELADAHWEALTFQRETAAPVIGQTGDATVDSVTIGVTGFTKLARKRRLRIADTLTGGGALVTPSEDIFDAGNGQVPGYIDIARSAIFVPTFSWMGNDPVGHGFTKAGSAPTEAIGAGWRINSLTTDAATYYTKSSWPAGAFATGFTIDLTAPVVNDTDNANPAQSVAVRIEDGTHRYELTFDADEVKLNGGTSHALAGARIRLVVVAGGTTADLWIGDTLIEDNTAFQSTSTSGLKFGDLVTTDDADAVWQSFGYGFSVMPVRLAQTIYVAVAHSSGGDWTPDSNILTVTFASEGSGSGGSAGVFDPTPRNKIDYDL
jgi:hypothetical protein